MLLFRLPGVDLLYPSLIHISLDLATHRTGWVTPAVHTVTCVPVVGVHVCAGGVRRAGTSDRVATISDD